MERDTTLVTYKQRVFYEMGAFSVFMNYLGTCMTTLLFLYMDGIIGYTTHKELFIVVYCIVVVLQYFLNAALVFFSYLVSNYRAVEKVPGKSPIFGGLPEIVDYSDMVLKTEEYQGCCVTYLIYILFNLFCLLFSICVFMLLLNDLKKP